MRLETQKQIVKAFSMMYEDTDMSLSELIEKLQQLSGGPIAPPRREKRQWRKNTDKEILNVMDLGVSMRIGNIIEKISNKVDRSSLEKRLNNLITQEKIKKVKINQRLNHYIRTV